MKLKKIFMTTIALVVLLFFPIVGDTYQHNYHQLCGVYEVHDNYTVFIDPAGYLWETTDTNYQIGEDVMIYFHDNFTDFNREDDIIKKIKRVD